jgi:hypothetical protein
MMLPK